MDAVVCNRESINIINKIVFSAKHKISLTTLLMTLKIKTNSAMKHKNHRPDAVNEQVLYAGTCRLPREHSLIVTETTPSLFKLWLVIG